MTLKDLRIVIVAWVGSKNMGDELILATQLKLLRAEGVEQITVLSKNPEITKKQHGVDAEHMNNFFGVCRAFKNADAVIFGGGGIIQEATSMLNLPYHLSRLFVATYVYKLPLLLMGIGVDPIKSRFGRWLCKLVLSKAQKIVVRDLFSRECLIDLGLGDRTEVTADLVLSSDVAKYECEPEKVININLRPLAQAKRFMPMSMRSHGYESSDMVLLAEAFDEIHRDTGYELRFLSFEEGRDDVAAAEIMQRMNYQDADIVNVTYDDAIEWLSRGAYTIATRYHAGICSVIAGRPTVLIGYSPKVVSLAEALPHSTRLVENNTKGYRQILGTLQELIGANADMKGERQDLLEKAEKNLVFIRSFLYENFIK